MSFLASFFSFLNFNGRIFSGGWSSTQGLGSLDDWLGVAVEVEAAALDHQKLEKFLAAQPSMEATWLLQGKWRIISWSRTHKGKKKKRGFVWLFSVQPLFETVQPSKHNGRTIAKVCGSWFCRFGLMKDLYKGDKGNIGALKWGHEVIAWEAPDPTKNGIHQPIVSTLGIHTVQPRVRSCLVLWKSHDLNKVSVPPGRGQSCSCGKNQQIMLNLNYMF